MSVKLYVEI